MADAHYEDDRLARVYDPLDTDRSDLDVYDEVLAELGARRVLDVGCGTGSLGLLLAARGVDVVGVDPAAASLRVARAKPGSERVRWVLGSADDLARSGGAVTPYDAVTMTGNVAQAIVDDGQWLATLRASHDLLRPGGHLVLETRVTAARAWEAWTPAATLVRAEVDGVGVVESWQEVLEVALPLVRFRTTFRFAGDGDVLVSESTLRFRERDEVVADLTRVGLEVVEVRDAPDRPGREHVVIARRARSGGGTVES